MGYGITVVNGKTKMWEKAKVTGENGAVSE